MHTEGIRSQIPTPPIQTSTKLKMRVWPAQPSMRGKGNGWEASGGACWWRPTSEALKIKLKCLLNVHVCVCVFNGVLWSTMSLFSEILHGTETIQKKNDNWFCLVFVFSFCFPREREGTAVARLVLLIYLQQLSCVLDLLRSLPNAKWANSFGSLL